MAIDDEDREVKRDTQAVMRGSGLSLIPAEEVSIEDPDRMRTRIVYLRDTIDCAYFELAKLLHGVWHGGADGKPLYLKWGFHSFNEYVEKELDFAIRKAQYLISIWNWFGVKVGDKEVIEKVKPLGWTKVKELVGVISKQNAEEWIAKAQNMSAPALAEEARKAIRADKELTEKMQNAPPEVGEAVKRKAPEPIHKWPFALFSDQFDIVDAAINRAKEMGNTEKEGQALTLVCQDFLATNKAIAAGDHKKEVAVILGKYEKLLGVRIIAIDAEAKQILCGHDVIQELGSAEGGSEVGL